MNKAQCYFFIVNVILLLIGVTKRESAGILDDGSEHVCISMFDSKWEWLSAFLWFVDRLLSNVSATMAILTIFWKKRVRKMTAITS